MPTRRDLLRLAGNGFGLVALSDLIQRTVSAAEPQPFRRPAKAKRCIFLFMTGGPSQMDIYDPKPLLNKLDRSPCPRASAGSIASSSRTTRCAWGAIGKWGKYGESGMDMSDLVPHMHAARRYDRTVAVVLCR